MTKEGSAKVGTISEESRENTTDLNMILPAGPTWATEIAGRCKLPAVSSRKALLFKQLFSAFPTWLHGAFVTEMETPWS